MLHLWLHLWFTTKSLCCICDYSSDLLLSLYANVAFETTALIIYAADTDYSRRFHAEGDDFIVDEDNFMLMRDNGSLVVTFPSGTI